MDALVSLKCVSDELSVEYEVIPVVDENGDCLRNQITEGIKNADALLDELYVKIDEVNKEIDKLTNHADGLDYMVAVGSGIIAGVIDLLFVEEFSLDKANELGDKKAEDKVIKTAQKKGYKGDDLAGAVAFLAKKYNIAADKGTNTFGGGRHHHLRDFSHHPTPVGLFFSILTQYTNKVFGTDVSGKFTCYELKDNEMVLIGKNLPEKITFGVVNWYFHMISDMCGESTTIRSGGVPTGLPGPIVSMLKEMSALPIFKNTNKQGYKEFSVWISKLFNGTLLGERNENGKIIKPLKFDFRTEMGIAQQLVKQAIPVIINECIVRGFYFLRRLYMELKTKNICSVKDLGKINWEMTLPMKNRTVNRMLTISTGTMTTIDVADATIRSGGFNASCLLRVNFVGIGRFAIAIGTDVAMGIKKGEAKKERDGLLSEIIRASNMKLYYKNADLMCAYSDLYKKEAKMYSAEADVWIVVEDTQKSIDELYEQMEKVGKYYLTTIQEMDKSLDNIEGLLPEVEKMNPGLIDEMLRRLRG